MGNGKRNPSIELYRVLLTLGICLLHSITMCGHSNGRLSALLFPCVNGFVFISGWFGVSFSFKRFWKLVFNALYAGGMVILLVWLFMPEQLSFTKECFKTIRYVVIGQWFFLAYAVLMLVAPAINYVIEHLDRELAKQILIPFGVLALWNWSAEVPVLNKLSYPAGFGSYTPLALATTYIVARLAKRFELLSNVKITHVVIGVVALSILFFAFPSLNLSQYVSPLATAFVCLFFVVFLSLRFPEGGGRIVTALAPSMFTVYLIHSHAYGFMVMARLENALLGRGWNIFVCYLVVAVSVFAVGVVADIPRRLLMAFLGRHHSQGVASCK